LLRRHPDCNVIVRHRRLWQRESVDIFHQVAMPLGDGRGGADLSGAVVRRADTKRVEEIARELAEGARRVREKKDGEMARTRGLLQAMPSALLTPFMALLDVLAYDLNLSVPGMPPDPFGSAMVTSVGMLGIKSGFAPLVTFSHCPLILLLGQVEDRAVVRDGRVVIRPMVTLTSTIDHRIVDGYQAGVLASELRRMLEEPDLLDSGLPD
jgi:pyruvate dehydrogenase E2 component (dihydrolipoamide acetyltransferase)